MFGGLREGNVFYIFDKNELTLQIGEVVEVKNPITKYGQGVYPASPFAQLDKEIDIKVKVGNAIHNISQLPCDKSFSLKNNVFVSDNEAEVKAEIDSVYRNAKYGIENQSYFQKAASACENMYVQLNPNLAKEKQQEEKIVELEKQIGSIDSKLNRMYDLLSESIGQGKSKKE